MDISKAAAAMGRIGGSRKSKRKTEAVRLNGKLGGRPKKSTAAPKNSVDNGKPKR